MFLEYIFTYNLKFSAIFKHFWSRGVRAGAIVYFGNYTFFQKLHKNKMFLEFDFALEYQISLQSNQFYQFYGIRFLSKFCAIVMAQNGAVTRIPEDDLKFFFIICIVTLYFFETFI